MSPKPSHQIPSNRPEAGGADKDERLEKSGILEREQERFATRDREKQTEFNGTDQEKEFRQSDRAEPAEEQQLDR